MRAKEAHIHLAGMRPKKSKPGNPNARMYPITNTNTWDILGFVLTFKSSAGKKQIRHQPWLQITIYRVRFNMALYASRALQVRTKVQRQVKEVKHSSRHPHCSMRMVLRLQIDAEACAAGILCSVPAKLVCFAFGFLV